MTAGLYKAGLYKDEEAAIHAMAVEQLERQIVAYQKQVDAFEAKYHHGLDEHSRLLAGKASMEEEDDWMEWRGAVVMLEAWQQALREVLGSASPSVPLHRQTREN